MELDVDVASASIEQLVERRSASQEEANRTEELWKVSERRVRERRRRELREEWRAFHEHMRELHVGLAQEHRQKAAALLNGEGAT